MEVEFGQMDGVDAGDIRADERSAAEVTERIEGEASAVLEVGFSAIENEAKQGSIHVGGADPIGVDVEVLVYGIEHDHVEGLGVKSGGVALAVGSDGGNALKTVAATDHEPVLMSALVGEDLATGGAVVFEKENFDGLAKLGECRLIQRPHGGVFSKGGGGVGFEGARALLDAQNIELAGDVRGP